MNVIVKNIPNTVTLCNLLSGIMATISALQGADPAWNTALTGYQWAWIWIGAAAVFDFCDGAAARMLRAYSELGKELDSLCDMVSFGVAPAAMVYTLISEHSANPWVGLIALFIAAMGALRLARFNIDTRQTSSFIGLPIPANAIFWIGATAWVQAHFYPGTWVVALLVVAVSLLMVCPMQIFSLKFKNFAWRENFRRYVIIAAAVLFVATDGVPGLMWTILLYLLISALGRKDL